VHAVKAGIGFAHQLIGALGRRIERNWAVDRVRLAEGNLGIGAVNRARRCIDEQGLPSRLAHQFQDRQVTNQVGRRIDKGIFDRVSHASLGCQMNHDVHVPDSRQGDKPGMV